MVGIVVGRDETAASYCCVHHFSLASSMCVCVCVSVLVGEPLAFLYLRKSAYIQVQVHEVHAYLRIPHVLCACLFRTANYAVVCNIFLLV